MRRSDYLFNVENVNGNPIYSHHGEPVTVLVLDNQSISKEFCSAEKKKCFLNSDNSFYVRLP